MTELSKLLPVVFTAVQLSSLLIVPVSQVVTAHRTSERKKHGPGHVRSQNKAHEQRGRERHFEGYAVSKTC